MLVQDTISLSTVQRKTTYKLDILQRSILGGIANENKIEIVLEKEFLGEDHKGNVFQIRLQERTHTNKDELHTIEHDLALLKGNLVLRTNKFGEIVDILNLKDIEKDWAKHKSKFYKIHRKFDYIDTIIEETTALLQDKKLFLSLLQETEMATVLFPPIYNTELSVTQEVQQEKIITDFFGTEALPLNITTSIKKKDPIGNKIEILRNGVLNTETFEAYEVRKYFRKLTDNYKLLTEVKVDYIETYDLDRFHWIDFAGQILNVTIKGLFTFQQIVRVTPLNKSL